MVPENMDEVNTDQILDTLVEICDDGKLELITASAGEFIEKLNGLSKFEYFKKCEGMDWHKHYGMTLSKVVSIEGDVYICYNSSKRGNHSNFVNLRSPSISVEYKFVGKDILFLKETFSDKVEYHLYLFQD